MNLGIDFILDMTDSYDRLTIAVLVCSNKKDYQEQTKKILDTLDIKENFVKSNAVHVAFREKDPISLIVLTDGYPISVLVHELFHAARHYFKLHRRRINENGDETFAHLLSDLVTGYLDQCPGHLIPAQNTVELGRNAPPAKAEANHG